MRLLWIAGRPDACRIFTKLPSYSRLNSLTFYDASTTVRHSTCIDLEFRCDTAEAMPGQPQAVFQGLSKRYFFLHRTDTILLDVV